MKLRALIAIILLCSVKVYSQSSLGTTLNLTLYNQQQYYNDSVTIPGMIRNTGNQVINDTILIKCAVDTGNGALTMITYYQIGAVSMQSNSTVNFTISFPISPNNFRLGNNIVVVWPVASSPAIQCETVSINCEVLGFTAINEINTTQKNLFPNPFKDQLFVSDNNIKQVRIYNSLGQIFILPVVNGVIRFSDNFGAGLYVVELGKGRYVKVVKE